MPKEHVRSNTETHVDLFTIVHYSCHVACTQTSLICAEAIATMRNRNVVVLFIVLVLLTVLYFTAYYPFEIPRLQTNSPNIETKIKQCVKPNTSRVHVCVFTGRWMYLRILLPYLYRELRQNGGVVDRVLFAMIGYNKETQVKLQKFSTAANSILQDDAFQFVYLKEDPSETHDPRSLYPFYSKFYYVVLQHLVRNPADVYFKLDDDIVYLHPNVFGSMLKNKNTSDCFMHFGNIVTNWRCNWLHQKIGVYDNEVNPKGFKFDYDPAAPCGWKGPECAEMVLRAFVHHYHKKQLSRYLFQGRDLTTKGQRFSINLFLLDIDLVDMQRMMKLGAIRDDEVWWTIKYSGGAQHTNCIVGEALVVHFSYSVTAKQMLDLGLLKEFENIVLIELGDILPGVLWNATDFL